MSPDSAEGNIDFYVDGRKALSSADYKTYSPYQALAAGQHTFDVRKAGAATGSTPDASIAQSLDSGYWSVFVGGKVGSSTCPIKAVAFSDDFTTPPAGQVVARFVHMAPEVPGVDVVLTNTNPEKHLFDNVACFQASSYGTFPAGDYPVALNATGKSDQLFSTTALMSKAGVVWTLVGAGGVGQPVVLAQIPDASSAGVSPVGAAATGDGGTAFGGLGALRSLGLIVTSLVACALLLLTAARRARA
jgi:hypothetical protein